MKLTDWIIAGAAFFQVCFAGVICWLTRRYVVLQGDLVNLQKSFTTLQDTVVQWQTRIQIEPRLYFYVTEKQEFGESGIVGLRVGNLSAIGVWLDSVQIIISESGPKRDVQVIHIDDVLPPDKSREIEIWTLIDNYGKQHHFESVHVFNVRIVATCVANNKTLDLTKECRFDYNRRKARNFVLTAS
jgi:hypothetical protein